MVTRPRKSYQFGLGKVFVIVFIVALAFSTLQLEEWFQFLSFTVLGSLAAVLIGPTTITGARFSGIVGGVIGSWLALSLIIFRSPNAHFFMPPCSCVVLTGLAIGVVAGEIAGRFRHSIEEDKTAAAAIKGDEDTDVNDRQA